ncbi:MAG: relaxase domain-containing protein [Gemmataceae bacterium]|nr:relaxase domain-containing protein [Gemmataceae bacterium]
MLSVHKIRSGGAYHAYLRSEYYLGQDATAEWFGRGAETLRLSGPVDDRDLVALMGGLTRDGRRLVESAGARPDPETGKGGHQVGWDLTFSAPKPFGVLWSAADPETRGRLEGCHVAAVKAALGYIEQTGAHVRVKEAGKTRLEPCGLVAALIHHDRSRANDPQPHTHAYVANVGVTSGGKTRTVESGGFYALKMAAGALYRASLAHGLRTSLGLELDPHGVAFSVRGVPEPLVEAHSRRRADVLQKLDELRDTRRIRRASARAAELAALETRRAKEVVPVEESRRAWRAINDQHGLTEAAARSLLSRSRAVKPPDFGRLVRDAARDLTQKQSYFSEPDLLRRAAERCQDGRADAESLRAAVRRAIGGPGFVRLGTHKRWEQFTTKEMLGVERRLFGTVERLAGDGSHRVRRGVVERLAAERFPNTGKLTADERARNNEQRAAVERLTAEGGGIALLAGMAGTGKTTVLRTCKDIWEKAGFRVTGIALAGVAAENLREKAGIESDTLAMRLTQLERASAGKDAKRPFNMDAKTVVVLDEAGMVGTRQLERLARNVADAGAKLVLVGDSKQLQPIDAGGPFASLARRIGAATLDHITRQKQQADDPAPTWAREAVRAFAAGRAEDGLRLFADRGLVHVAPTRGAAMKRLVREWEKAGGLERPGDHVILAGTNREVDSLNALCQRRRLRAGRVAVPDGGRTPKRERQGVTVERDGHSERILRGDRVLFTEKDRSIGVENGHFGTVAGIRRTTGGPVVKVRLDGGAVVRVATTHYHGLRLGYAATTHKLQGATCERAYVLVGGTMQDRHLSYVQSSRAVEQTRFYVDRYEAGEGLADVTRQMGQDREKRLAVDLLDGPGRERGHQL